MPTEFKHDIAVILVGLNASRFVEECLQSLQKAVWRDRSFETICVDNGSVDDTLQMLQRYPWVKVIANPTNLGFCKAANQGAAIANAQYYFFLNDDTIVLDDAIALLADFLDAQGGRGVAGSRLLYPDMTDQWSGRRFPSILNGILGRRSFLSRLLPNAKPLTDYLYRDEIARGEPFQADWVSAAALMADRETFHRVGGFAEDYYYWHEAVFCDRVRRIGREVYMQPRSMIIHYEGKGSGARPYHVMRFHIIDFHRGAYRCYCDHYRLGRLSLQRWFAALALSARAALLLTRNWLFSPRQRAAARPS